MKKYSFLVIGVIVGILVFSVAVSAGFLDWMKGEESQKAPARQVEYGVIKAHSCDADNTCEVNGLITSRGNLTLMPGK